MHIIIKTTGIHPQDSESFGVFIDDDPVSFSIKDNDIIIQSEKQPGFYLFKLKSKFRIKILDVIMDGDSIRNMRWLSFTKKGDNIFQPSDRINDPDEIWCLPLIYPLSSMYNYVLSKIPNGLYGSNLHEKYTFFFPQKIKISNNHPGVLQSYFKHDSCFGIASKDSSSIVLGADVPFRTFDLAYDRAGIENEIINAIKKQHLVFERKTLPHQTKLNSEEYGYPNPWNYTFFMRSTSSGAITQRFELQGEWKNLLAMLENLKVKHIKHGFISILPKGSYIYPHCDSMDGRWNNDPDHIDLYVPLVSNQKVYFKFGNFGLVDLRYPHFINNRRFAHSVVNDSDQDRFILSLKIKL